MSDIYDEGDENDEPGKVTIDRSQIKSWQKQAKEGAADKVRAEAAERKLAFAEAGISLSDPKLSYFVKGYDGEFTPEAIKQAATEAGFIASENSDDTAALDRLNQAGAGASSPNVGADAAYLAEMDAATSSEQVTAIAAKYGRLVAPQ